MMTEFERALGDVLDGAPKDGHAERQLRSLLTEVQARSCQNLVAKLSEYKGAYRGQRLGALSAELRMACVVADQTAATMEFDVSDAADIRFKVGADLCLVEVAHKSAPNPLSTILHPDPDELPSYQHGPPWKQAGYRLHTKLQTLPLRIQPYVSAEFLRDEKTWKDISDQETAVGGLADWLHSKLPASLAEETTLRHPDGKTYFELSPLDSAPGYIQGVGGIEPWFVDENSFRSPLERKFRKASQRCIETGAAAYLIGVDVEDAIASLGDQLLTTLIGPLVSQEGVRFRPVPAGGLAMVEDAKRAGRTALLQMAKFDVTQTNLHGFEPGLYFEPFAKDVSGVVALYYTRQIQFVANPFATRDPKLVGQFFPATNSPFAPT